MTIQQHASFDSSAAELNATSKLVKAWESKNAKNAAKAGGVSLMALSLAACGGSSSTTTTSTDTTTDTTTTVVTPQSLTSATDDAYVGSESDPDNQGVTITANQLTLHATDKIDAGSGTDTLAITNTAANGGILPAQLNGVENIQMTSYGASSIDLLVATGVEKVVSLNSVADDTFSNVQSLASVEVDGSENAVTVTYADTLVTATAEAAVEVKGGATVSVLNIGGVSSPYAEFATINITSSGASANTFTLIEDGNSAAVGGLVTVNVTGSADLTLGTGLTAFAGNNSAADMTLNAAAATGDLTVTGTNFENITLGAGDDTLLLGATQVSDTSTAGQVVLNGGAGANTLAFGAQNLADAGLANQSVATDNDSITNFQTLTFEVVKTDAGQATDVDRAVDANAISGVTTIYTDMQNLEASDSVDGDVGLTVSGIVAGQTIQVSSLASAGNQADEDLILNMDSPTGTTDAITLESVASAATTAHVNSLASVTVEQTTVSNVAQSVETLNLVATRADVSDAAGTQIATLVAENTGTVSITGSGGVTIGAIDLLDASTADTTVATIDASAHTGDFTLGVDGTDFQNASTNADDYSVTLGAGTNTVYGEAALDDGDTITGTTGTDTVDLVAGTGAVNLVNIDTVQLTGSSSSSASAENWDVTTLDITNSTASATVSNLAAGQAIKSDDIDSGATLTLNVATGVTALAVELDTENASAGTLATNATDLTINHSGVDSSGDFVDDALILSSDVTSVTLTGGGETASAGTHSKFTLSNGSGATIASITSSYDGDLDVDAGSMFNASTGATVTTGANTVAATTFAAVADLTSGLVHFNDTAGTDTLSLTSTGADLGVINVDGYETFKIADLDMGAAMAVNFRDSAGISTISITGPSATDLVENITLSNVASGTTLAVAGAYGDGSADTLAVTASTGSSDTIVITTAAANLSSANAAAAITASGFETVTVAGGLDDDIDFATYDALLTLTGTKTITLGGDTVAATDSSVVKIGTMAATSTETLAVIAEGGNTSIADLGTMNSLETFTIAAAASMTATVTAGTSTSVDAITITGAGATTITALTAASLDTISAGDATGVVTLGSSSAALTTAAGATFTTGTGDDVITMSTASSLTLTAGEKTSDGDNLILVGTMNSGAGVINLSSADQVVTINGTADAAVQSQFEDVDVSAVTTTGSYGFGITAAAEGSTIVGSGANDTIYGGAGADTITGGAGADTINLSVDGEVDTVHLTVNNGTDTVNDFLKGEDVFNVGAWGSETAMTTVTSTTITIEANHVYFLSAALNDDVGDLDSTILTDINSAATWIEADVVAYFVLVDTTTDNTAVYKYDYDAGTSIAADELELFVAVDSDLTADSFIF